MNDSAMASVGGEVPETQAQLAQDSPHFDNNGWANMGVIQSTMASFASADLAYAPPVESHQSVAPRDTLNRMRPLQPRQSQEDREALDRQQQQEQEKQQQHQQHQQQQSPLSLSNHLPHLHQYQLQPHLQQQTPLPVTQPMLHHHHHHHHAVHHDLPQLNTLMSPSSTTWPSMLIDGGYSAASAPMPTLSPLVPALHPPSSNRIVAPRTRPPPPPLKTKLYDREGKPGPRKMLTEDDRKRMCQYADAHPGIKQSEIGKIFGVERSTVSKVLRKRDKYLRDERSLSPGSTKIKNKFPDVERALSSWVRNAQKTGVVVTDAEIQDKFRFFAASAGSPDSIVKANTTSSWLEKFKQKNGIGTGRLVRRASETNIPDHRIGSLSSSGFVGSSPSLMPMASMESMDLASNESPLSPVAGRRPSVSPLSPGGHRSDDEQDVGGGRGGRGRGSGSGGGSRNTDSQQHLIGAAAATSTTTSSMHMVGLGLTTGMGNYKHSSYNQSTTSLSSVFTTETPVSSFSGSALSPTVPFTFSPDANDGSFLSSPMAPPGSSNFQRPRSQTLPALFNIELMEHGGGSSQQLTLPPPPLPSQVLLHRDGMPEAATPKYRQQEQPQLHQQHQFQHILHHHHHHLLPQPSQQQPTQSHRLVSTAPSSAVDSPMTDISGPSFGIDSTVVSPRLRRSSSNSSLLVSGGGGGGSGSNGGGAPRSAGGLGGATLLGSNSGGGGGSSSSSGGGGGGGGGSGGDGAAGVGSGGAGAGAGGSGGSTSPNHNNNSGGSNNNNTPSQDDARRAADTLLTFLQTIPGGFDQNDHNVIARLVEKLRLQGGSGGGGSSGGVVTTKMMPGVSILSRIPEGEGELSSEGSGHHQQEFSDDDKMETQMIS